MSNKLILPCDAGKVSDGYHTFGELYEHRNLLFLLFIKNNPECGAWKSKKHYDGSGFEGWFIAGIRLASGDITYHLPLRLWDWCYCKELEVAPEWDGHDSEMTLAKIMDVLR